MEDKDVEVPVFRIGGNGADDDLQMRQVVLVRGKRNRNVALLECRLDVGADDVDGHLLGKNHRAGVVVPVVCPAIAFEMPPDGGPPRLRFGAGPAGLGRLPLFEAGPFG